LLTIKKKKMKNVQPFLIAAASGAVAMIVLSKVGVKGAKSLDMTSAAMLGAITGVTIAGVQMIAPKLLGKAATTTK
jgi:hypothetical protein